MKKIIVCILLLSTLIITIRAQGIVFEKEETAWADILKKAKTENKIIFVDAFTTWCGPCKLMSKTIFPTKEVGDVFNAHFINAKIDMEKGEGLEIAKRYNVMAYPTYLFVNSDGELVHRSLGGMPAEKFVSVGEAATDPNRQFFSLKKKFEAGEKSPEFLKNFANVCEDAQETELTPVVAEAYLGTQKDWLTKDNMSFILKYTKSIDKPTFAFLVKNQEAFEKEFGKMEVESMIEETAFKDVANASFNRQTHEFDMEKAKNLASKSLSTNRTDKLLSQLLLTQYDMSNEIPQFLKQAIVHFDKFPSNNPQELNQFAWAFFEKSDDKAQLEKALTWSLKSIEIINEFAYKDTAASLYYKLGNKEKAKKYAEEAIKQAKAAGDSVPETEELLKKIEAM